VSTTDGPTWIQEFRCAVSELRLGDELTHAYVDASDWTNHRRAALLDRYGFVCACARCPKDEHGAPFDPPKPIPTRTPPSAEDSAETTALSARAAFCRESAWAALAMPNDKRAQVTIEIASKLLSDAERAEEVSKERELAEKAAGLLRGISLNDAENPENPYALGAAAPFPTTPMRARALAMASNMAMFESDFEAALRLGEELVACLVEAYGTKWHAKIAYELFKLASVAGDGLGDAARAAAKFREALEIGEVALGGDAWMCRKAREYLEGTSSS
jgi:SET and MYND domain-containing protein